MAILEVRGLSKDFGGMRAVNELDIDIRDDEIFGLIGPNGSGKTTCLNVITGFLEPTTGSVAYKGQLITGFKPYQIAERGLIRTFQLTSLFLNLTVEENIITARHLKTSGGVLSSFFNTRSYRSEEMKLRQKAGGILSIVGMEEKRDVLAKNLPPGDQRKLEVAIALATEPQLLFLDEPAAGMNPAEAAGLVSMLQTIQQTGVTIAIIEHNMRVVMGLCTHIVVLDHGSKVVEGTPEEISRDERVISIYLGRRAHAQG